MNRLKNWVNILRKQIKFAAYDPTNFDEIFGFTSSRVNIISLFIVSIVSLSVLIVFLFSKTSLGEMLMLPSKQNQNNVLIEQQLKLDSLERQVQSQENYIKRFQSILLGKESEVVDSNVVKNNALSIDVSKIKDQASKAEMKLAEKVKSDQLTFSVKPESDIVYFLAPIEGVVSQKYNAENHRGIDVVTGSNAYFMACMSGAVIFTDYSNKDGNVLILDHGNGYISVYKHAKSILKKVGDRVQVGDIVGIVGNTGTHSSGPHLHFELWLNQQAVDPQKYMNFVR